METNPYYDAGWAQSVRRDDPNNNYKKWGEGGSNYNGYNDPGECRCSYCGLLGGVVVIRLFVLIAAACYFVAEGLTLICAS
jgi:hypothetical protein